MVQTQSAKKTKIEDGEEIMSNVWVNEIPTLLLYRFILYIKHTMFIKIAFPKQIKNLYLLFLYYSNWDLSPMIIFMNFKNISNVNSKEEA